MTLHSTPQATAMTKFISPFAAQYPAGGITSSLGTGRMDDSSAIKATMPGYPSCSKPLSSQSTNRSSIEAVLPDQGHKARVAQSGHLDAAGGPPHEREGLVALRPERDDHPAAGRQLIHEWLRYLRPAGRDENGVVGRVGAPAEGPVPYQQRHVGRGRSLEGDLRRFGEDPHALDREDLVRKRRQQRRLVPRAGADFEDALLAGHRQRFEVARLRKGLGDGLAVADRQRRVLVGAVAHGLRDEEVAWSLRKGSQHREIPDALGPEALDEAGPRSPEPLAAPPRPFPRFPCRTNPTRPYFVRATHAGGTGAGPFVT